VFSNTSITTSSTGVTFGNGLLGTHSTNNANTFLTSGTSNAYSLTSALNVNN
jgi:hypothetical protein